MIRRPLFWSTLPFASGILLAPSGLPPAAGASLAFVLLLGGLCLARVGRSRPGGRAGVVFVLAGWGACGSFAGGLAGSSPRPSVAALLERHPDALREGAVVSGVLASPVTVRLPRAAGPCSLEGVVAVRRVRLGRLWHPVEGKVSLRLMAACDEAAPLKRRWRRGDLVSAFARLAPPRQNEVPGGFDASRHQRGRGLHGLAHVKSLRLMTVTPSSPHGPWTALMRSMDGVRASLLENIERACGGTRGGRRAAAVSSALLLGERGTLDPDDARRLQESGLTHLLAVSGFNVAILVGVCLTVAGLAGCRGAPACALCLVVMSGYLLLNRDESSVARAVIMASALLGARGAGLWADPRNSLGLAAIVLLGHRPLLIHEAGFQLTFVATVALLEMDLLAPAGRRRGCRWARDLAFATVAAMVATAPLLAWHFNRVCPGALPANLLAGPLMSVAFVLVLAMQAAAPVSGEAARILALLVDRLVDLVFAVSDLVTAMPGLSYRRPTPALAWILVYLAALSAAVVLRRQGRALACRAALAIWVAAAAWLACPLDTRGRPDGVRVTALDVGQGDALLVETPQEKRLLIDAGGAMGGEFDVGERVVSRALWHMGIASIDLLVITHADQDHAGGAPSVARNFLPREIWVPPGWHAGAEAQGRRLTGALRGGTTLREAGRGTSVCLAGARVEVLHPSGEGNPGDNNRSIVLWIAAPGGGALMMGDAGAPVEKSLELANRSIRLLKVGHHGSRTGSSSAFLRTVRPRAAIVSCGRHNSFGHPHPGTIARLLREGAFVLRTDLHGTVGVELLPGATRLEGLFRTADRRGGG